MESSREESSKSSRKRARAAESVVMCLDRLTDVVGNELKEGRSEFARIAGIFEALEKKKDMNKAKLNAELNKLTSLSFEKKHKIGMKLIRDPDLLDYFLLLKKMRRKNGLDGTLDVNKKFDLTSPSPNKNRYSDII